MLNDLKIVIKDICKRFFFLEMVKYFYMPCQYELNAPIRNLLFRLWKKKDHQNICDCDLTYGDCLAKID